MKKLLISFIIILYAINAYSQKIAISTDAIGYINLLTLNGEIDISLDKNWSVCASGKYNPFTYNKNKEASKQFQNRQACMALGVKYWPWFIYSGWYYESKIQYKEYNKSHAFSHGSYEGNALGLGINIGYALLVSKHFNMEFGLGIWAGNNNYTKYACPRCGEVLDKGTKTFITPNEVLLSLVYTL